VVAARVGNYAREIVPAFNAYLYFRVGYCWARGWPKLLYRVRLGYTDSQAIAAINPKSSIVFVMNTAATWITCWWLFSRRSAWRCPTPWANGPRIWPLQQLIRSMGAYFVRRNSGDPLIAPCSRATCRWRWRRACLRRCTGRGAHDGR